MADLASSVQDLTRLLMVEELDTDLYRGFADSSMPGRMFGGQVIAQALAAATAGIGDERVAHSLHAYFLRAGDNARPVIYRVIRDFDGGTFANRRVVALQDGKPILNLATSFQRREEGLSHSVPLPQVTGPEQAIPLRELLSQRGAQVPPPIASLLAAFDMRAGPPDPKGTGALGAASGLPNQHSWLKLDPALGSGLARTALAYASDFGLVSTAILPHDLQWFSPEIQGASLDHAIWFHEDPPLGEWLLYAMDSPWSGKGRGFTRGAVYDQSGRLIASMAQEGLMRYRPRG
ncbi:acyl-CoA thioesterase-2 [Novosphingobium chloroacetimidivorans]|uniref:Acyl-CoA thioesterase-2 n=1 Tax=Novosphingobium chloroacetimidivorans TaxID=1428314 RepID=A0A7W7KDI5_9SPHN|nr:acyl-CoA thioesterase domain-containing protein [Novosphingobium chloroacetimidivorans]MBB4860490.1 acyl-CoA thioesterase-2 [Novosphingobium chloroacetimidivorans]